MAELLCPERINPRKDLQGLRAAGHVSAKTRVAVFGESRLTVSLLTLVIEHNWVKLQSVRSIGWPWTWMDRPSVEGSTENSAGGTHLTVWTVLSGESGEICVNFVSVATGKPLQASLVTHLLTT